MLGPDGECKGHESGVGAGSTHLRRGSLCSGMGCWRLPCSLGASLCQGSCPASRVHELPYALQGLPGGDQLLRLLNRRPLKTCCRLQRQDVGVSCWGVRLGHWLGPGCERVHCSMDLPEGSQVACLSQVSRSGSNCEIAVCQAQTCMAGSAWPG